MPSTNVVDHGPPPPQAARRCLPASTHPYPPDRWADFYHLTPPTPCADAARRASTPTPATRTHTQTQLFAAGRLVAHACSHTALLQHTTYLAWTAAVGCRLAQFSVDATAGRHRTAHARARVPAAAGGYGGTHTRCAGRLCAGGDAVRWRSHFHIPVAWDPRQFNIHFFSSRPRRRNHLPFFPSSFCRCLAMVALLPHSSATLQY